MRALEPHHHRCYWSRCRLTEISLSNGILTGAGIGIRTFLFALADAEPIWHAAELDTDDAIFLCLEPSEASQGRTPENPLLPPEIREGLGIAERTIDYTLAEELTRGLDDASTGSLKRAKHAIELHDDCFFRYTTRDSRGIEKVLGGILAQHRTYLGLQGPVEFAPALLRQLEEHGTLRLQSHPSTGRIHILLERDGRLTRWLRPWIHADTVTLHGPSDRG